MYLNIPDLHRVFDPTGIFRIQMNVIKKKNVCLLSSLLTHMKKGHLSLNYEVLLNVLGPESPVEV